MATCPSGHENPEGQRFCGECGQAVSAAGSGAATQLPSTPQPIVPGAPGKDIESGKPDGQKEPGGKGSVAKLGYWLLWWQFGVGAAVIIFGGIAGMYFGTHQPSVNAQQSVLTATTTTSSPKTPPTTTAVPGTLPGVATGSTTTTIPAAAATPGGTTSSTVSLVQAIALAMVAGGAALIPTGGAALLIAKAKAEQ